MTAHTPGPWHWEKAHGNDLRLCDSRGETVLDGWDTAGTEIPNEADKSLIAAAPDMLEALKRALFVLESPALLPLTNGAGTVDLVRAAITKAEGTQ